MDTPELFAAALGVAAPWYVARVDLAADQLTIAIDFRRGGRFPCPTCGAAGCPAHDTEERRWRHLNFFQYRTELVARVPLVACPRCGVHPVAVPWARPGSGSTLSFAAFVLTLAAAMPVAAIARLVGEHDTRRWRLVRHHVDEARAQRDDRRVRAVGIDETSRRRGHHYISLFVDLERHRVAVRDAEAGGGNGDALRGRPHRARGRSGRGHGGLLRHVARLPSRGSPRRSRLPPSPSTSST